MENHPKLYAWKPTPESHLGVFKSGSRTSGGSCTALECEAGIDRPFPKNVGHPHDQTEESDNDRLRQRETTQRHDTLSKTPTNGTRVRTAGPQQMICPLGSVTGDI